MNEHRPVAGSSGSGGEVDAVRETRPRPSLATLLAEAGVASEEQLRLATAEGMGSGERLGEVVLRRGWIDEKGLAQALARQWQLPFLSNEAARLEPQTPRLLPADLARALAACPVEAAAPLLAVAEPSEERFASLAAAIEDSELGFAIVTPGTLARLCDELERAEREMASVSAHEAPGEATEAELIEPLAAAIDEATRAVAALRGQVAELSERRQREKAELEHYRERLARLEDERTQAGEERKRLEEALGQQRELLATLRKRLAEAQALLEVAP
jgi:DNA repair exonuclease SbcCD ATPase subunit